MLRDKAYLLDMLNACLKIEKYVQGQTLDDFHDDDLLQDGIERNIEILGEDIVTQRRRRAGRRDSAVPPPVETGGYDPAMSALPTLLISMKSAEPI